MSRVQVNNEDGIQRDQDRELFIFQICMWYMFIRQFFQWESEFLGYKGDKGHIKVPGEQWEQDRELFIFFKYECDTCNYVNHTIMNVYIHKIGQISILLMFTRYPEILIMSGFDPLISGLRLHLLHQNANMSS